MPPPTNIKRRRDSIPFQRTGDRSFDQLLDQQYYHHQPIPSTSTLQPAPFVPNKRRMTVVSVPPSTKPTPAFLMGHSSPPRRHASPRSANSLGRPSIRSQVPGSAPPAFNRYASLGQGRPQQSPLSSSDPNFSSFVNAAAALTGLSHHRTPSGSEIFGPPPPLASPAAFSQHHYNQAYESPTSTNTIFRPQTPPSGRLMANGHQTLNQEDPTTDTAAELMLFLAASPSPVQSRQKDLSATEELGMKGRRLFSSGLIEDGNIFGRDLTTGDIFSGGDSHHSINEESRNSDSRLAASFEFDRANSDQAHKLPSTDPSKLTLAPTTPSRARSVSAGDWGNFINASPKGQSPPNHHLQLRNLL